jgi:coenzyme Q-binding protein COQ10
LECTNDVERTIRKQEEGGMPRHEEQKTLAYTTDELFSVVADVKDYPSFIPWCSGARVDREDSQEIIADLEIGFGPFRESFTSQVALDRPRRVLVRATEGGPLEHLTNTWTFTPAGAGTHVDFVIDFQFKSHLLDHLANSMFHEAATKMMGAFKARAYFVHILKQRRLLSSS